MNIKHDCELIAKANPKETVLVALLESAPDFDCCAVWEHLTTAAEELHRSDKETYDALWWAATILDDCDDCDDCEG